LVSPIVIVVNAAAQPSHAEGANSRIFLIDAGIAFAL
jgi:hypothetical protein